AHHVRTKGGSPRGRRAVGREPTGHHSRRHDECQKSKNADHVAHRPPQLQHLGSPCPRIVREDTDTPRPAALRQARGTRRGEPPSHRHAASACYLMVSFRWLSSEACLTIVIL